MDKQLLSKYLAFSLCALLLCCAQMVFAAETEKFSKDTSVVQVAQIYHASMKYIFSQQPLINSTSGNKDALFGNQFIARIKETYSKTYNKPFPSEQDIYVAHLLRQMKLVMEDNRTLLLDKDIEFKGFIPAIFAFQLSEKFKQRGYGINIKFTNFPERIRNELSDPDLWEVQALRQLNENDMGFILDDKSRFLGFKATRYMQPVGLTPMCLSCHGRKKDNPANYGKDKSLWSDIDKTGFKMEGWKMGELGGGISVVIYE